MPSPNAKRVPMGDYLAERSRRRKARAGWLEQFSLLIGRQWKQTSRYDHKRRQGGKGRGEAGGSLPTCKCHCGWGCWTMGWAIVCVCALCVVLVYGSVVVATFLC